ncbi:MAG: DegT/DnrJ/EryC1/StrS family aminotransferase [Candidatus Bipolaricaulota bacterium]
MNVPVFDLRRQYEAIRPEIDAAIHEVLASGEFILGSRVAEFEEAMASTCDVRHAIGLASGTDALLLSLKALGIGPGDAVLVPSFTFFATAGVVTNVGAVPLFCDIDARTFNLDPASARDVIAAHASSPHVLRALIPVHLFGQMADMEGVQALSAEFGLAVVEDAAQAVGAAYTWASGQAERPRLDAEGRRGGPDSSASECRTLAGSAGALGCFSFYPTKNLGAYGDAGMVTTCDDQLADKVRLLRAHGAKPKYVHHVVGTNSRLDAMQAAILSVKLRHLVEWTTARQAIAQRYDELLGGIPAIETPYRAPDRTHTFHQYTIRVTDGRRDALAAALQTSGIGTMIYYPGPLHRQACFASLGYAAGDFPQAERAAREVLSLPMFPELRVDEQLAVADGIRRFFRV